MLGVGRGLVAVAGKKAGGEARAPRALPGALRDPRRVGEVRRRPVRGAGGSVLLPRCAVRPPDHAQPDPHLLPAGAHEGPGQGCGLQGAARACHRRRRDGRRHRRGMRDARHHRDAAGHLARAPGAGGEARGGTVRQAPQGPASRARRAGPADPGRRGRRRRARRRHHRGDLREPSGQARALRAGGGGGQARRGPCHQHLQPQARGRRGTVQGPLAPRRHPLLQPGAAAAAGGSGVGRGHQRRDGAARPPPSCARSTSCRCR